jgi:hypothetical protein
MFGVGLTQPVVRLIPTVKETVMNRLLSLLFLVAVIGIVLGFYFGYFHISSENRDGTNRTTLSVDEQRLKDDGKKALQKVEGK